MFYQRPIESITLESSLNHFISNLQIVTAQLVGNVSPCLPGKYKQTNRQTDRQLHHHRQK